MARFAKDETFPSRVSGWLREGSEDKARNSRGLLKSREVVKFSLHNVGVHFGQQLV